jgi:hypothetical protein
MRFPPALERRISGASAMRIAVIVALLCAGTIARLSADAVAPTHQAKETSLAAVKCASAESCVSVGWIGGAFRQAPFAVQFAERARSDQSPPVGPRYGDATLSAVACLKSRLCIAVGRREVPTRYLADRSAGDRPLTAEWNGRRWRLRLGAFPPRTRSAALNGVDCTSSGCMAVGEYEPRGSDKTRPLAGSWDGKGWTVHLPERPQGFEDTVLNDVACVSARFCTSVGYVTYELMGLMTGGVAPVVERWDGNAWRVSAVPQAQGVDATFNAVACPSHRRCLAVGFQRLRSGKFTTLAVVWNGMEWKVVPTRDPPGSPDAEFEDVVCPLINRCIAVGWAVSASHVATLAALWNGSHWTLEETPNPPGATSSVLHAVDCAGPTLCHAVGSFARHSPNRQAFSEQWDGREWTLVAI